VKKKFVRKALSQNPDVKKEKFVKRLRGSQNPIVKRGRFCEKAS
jgi:hypothetical protein